MLLPGVVYHPVVVRCPDPCSNGQHATATGYSGKLNHVVQFDSVLSESSKSEAMKLALHSLPLKKYMKLFH
jgi:hypothetical protein